MLTFQGLPRKGIDLAQRNAHFTEFKILLFHQVLYPRKTLAFDPIISQKPENKPENTRPQETKIQGPHPLSSFSGILVVKSVKMQPLGEPTCCAALRTHSGWASLSTGTLPGQPAPETSASQKPAQPPSQPGPPGLTPKRANNNPTGPKHSRVKTATPENTPPSSRPTFLQYSDSS